VSLSSFDGLRMRGAVVEGLSPHPPPHPELVEGSFAARGALSFVIPLSALRFRDDKDRGFFLEMPGA
jgi:hypothetical protein